MDSKEGAIGFRVHTGLMEDLGLRPFLVVFVGQGYAQAQLISSEVPKGSHNQ